jgi:hypothetical protein
MDAIAMNVPLVHGNLRVVKKVEITSGCVHAEIGITPIA